jgi:hypothetical protein
VDLVVVVPGVLGSVLARDGATVWDVSPGAGWRALVSGLASVAELRLNPDVGDAPAEDGVTPVGLMGSLHVLPGVWSPVRGYSDLLRWLRRTFTLDPPQGDRAGNLITFPYDWRLSNRYNAGRLGAVVECALDRWRRAGGGPGARVVYLCHSMGGLLTRYYLEVLGGAETCRALVSMGTPYRGSLAALRQLVDGFRVGGHEVKRLTALARSLPSLHQLVPAYECVVRGAQLIRPQATDLPGPDPTLLADGARFHDEITARAATPVSGPRYPLYPIVGFAQPTPTTLRLDGGAPVWDMSIRGKDEGGDGRVPMLSSVPAELWAAGPVERAHVEKHGALQDHRGVREGITYALTRVRTFHRGPQVETGAFGVSLPEAVPAGRPWRVNVTAADDRLALTAAVTDAMSGAEVTGMRQVTLANQGGGRYGFTFAGLAPGLYEVVVSDPDSTAVTSHLIVWGENNAA